MSKPLDPADFSKLRSVEPMITDPNALPPTAGEQMKQNMQMFMEVSKHRPLSETLCLKEALIFGRISSKTLLINHLDHLGVPGSFFCSMATFLLTTNRNRIFQAAMLSLPVLTMARFSQCRAVKHHERKATILVSKMIQAKMLTDGTAKQDEFERLFKKSRVQLAEFERELDQIIAKQQTGQT